MKIVLMRDSARILAEKYDFHSSDLAERAVIDTESKEVKFLCSGSSSATKSEYSMRLKETDAIIIGDFAYYEDFDKISI